MEFIIELKYKDNENVFKIHSCVLTVLKNGLCQQ